MPTLRMVCLSRAVSPITHMLGTVGNEQVVNVETVRTPFGETLVPVLTGNALRQRMLRAPAAETLTAEWGLAGSLSRDELNLLFHGGLRREKGTGQSLRKVFDMQRLLPHLKLLGCCLPDGIVGGDLQADRAMLVCRENAQRIRDLVPAEFAVPEDLAPAMSFVGHWQYVRNTIRQTHPELMPLDDDERDKPMPFAGTCVIPGSEWLHGFRVRHATLLDLGCVLHSLGRWQAAGATIGGASAKGHGRLSLSLWCDPTTGFGELTPELQAEAVGTYLDALRTGREEGTAFLHSLYGAAAAADPSAESGDGEEGTPVAKPKRGRKARGKAEAPEPVEAAEGEDPA